MKIDESKFKESPTLFKRLINAILGFFYAFCLIQVIMFSTRGFAGSVIFLFDNYLFYGLLVLAAIFGWIYGSEFHGWLKYKMEEWNIWGFWH